MFTNLAVGMPVNIRNIRKWVSFLHIDDIPYYIYIYIYSHTYIYIYVCISVTRSPSLSTHLRVPFLGWLPFRRHLWWLPYLTIRNGDRAGQLGASGNASLVPEEDDRSGGWESSV